MRILSGRDKEGRVISTLLPARMTDIKDGALFMRWNFWVMEQMLKDPYMQVGSAATAGRGGRKGTGGMG